MTELPDKIDEVSPASGDEHHGRYCPVCSARLESRRCKLTCSRCGYFMSCSDFD